MTPMSRTTFLDPRRLGSRGSDLDVARGMMLACVLGLALWAVAAYALRAVQFS
jgi:hypothetical protein